MHTDSRPEGSASIPKMMPPKAFMMAMIAVVGLSFVDPVAVSLPDPWNWSGLLLVLGGLYFNISADNAFKREGTTVKPFLETTALVTDGVFAITRNPMYLGMVLVLVGAWMIVGGVLPAVVIGLFALWIDRRFILIEEAKLKVQIGGPYEAYCQKVRRWL